MINWEKSLIPMEATIREAMTIIDRSALQIGLVVNEKQELLGTLTDGDIRRGIIRGVDLDTLVVNIMFTQPTVAHFEDSREDIISRMKQHTLRHIPVLDHKRKVVGLEILLDLLEPEKIDNPVVLMAGGLGTRLRPLTENCPKPMLKVGNKPILETIIDSFIDYGFHKFYISVNYQAEKIEAYFGDGSFKGVEIKYIHETERLGTAGALSLLPEKLHLPLIVMNGDLLTKVNFKHLLDFHIEQNAAATMCVREYDFQVPYGVVKVDEHRITEIEEKPLHRFFVNGGIYVLSPEIISHIPKHQFFDMPDLFGQLKQKYFTAAFPIREYWMDIGQIDDFHQANGEFHKFF